MGHGSSRWRLLGAISFWTVAGATAGAVPLLLLLRRFLGGTPSLVPVAWITGGLLALLSLNLIGQTLACLGLLVPGTSRRWSSAALVAGIPALFLVLAALVAILWESGLLRPG